MRVVNVNKEELVLTVTENMVTHRAQFEEALTGWHKASIVELERLLEDAQNNRIRNMYVNLPRPEDHTTDYERVLQMLHMSVDDVVQLTEQEFAQFVQDDWGWKRQWLTSNSSYSSSIRDEAASSGLVIPDSPTW